jgi:hypothetical protein
MVAGKRLRTCLIQGRKCEEAKLETHILDDDKQIISGVLFVSMNWTGMEYG